MLTHIDLEVYKQMVITQEPVPKSQNLNATPYDFKEIKVLNIQRTAVLKGSYDIKESDDPSVFKFKNSEIIIPSIIIGGLLLCFLLIICRCKSSMKASSSVFVKVEEEKIMGENITYGF